VEEERKMILGTLREQYGRICWTHKTHEKEREFATYKTHLVKWIGIILTFATFLGIIAAVRHPESCILFWLVTILAGISFGFQLFNLSFEPEKNESAHRTAAKSLLRLREAYLILITRTMAGDNLKDIENDLSKISDLMVETYCHMPDSSSKGFQAATKALKEKEEMTFSDEEIDHLLPSSLRIVHK
jgi:hypothetical protein